MEKKILEKALRGMMRSASLYIPVLVFLEVELIAKQVGAPNLSQYIVSVMKYIIAEKDYGKYWKESG